ncbi:hypothetical protein APY04_1020 [Hyphomicrobium sulfonivorans]|uniref:Uncharacterized protein n=1 Tax=Hyphomicrobium sulfonivorans TaxID=121290 RepID=A0A109BK78_HYPSL|nr:hypothetical protein [Hyphomicrobium sulfonivorans]KWT70343.1 hypothetical protein APY04_1020 [Hyphomicrobium sulfonivorans]
MQRIAAWRAAPDSAVACPVCDAQGLTVLDRSARPHAEWYVLVCNACGLEHTLHIPMAPPATPFD